MDYLLDDVDDYYSYNNYKINYNNIGQLDMFQMRNGNEYFKDKIIADAQRKKKVNGMDNNFNNFIGMNNNNYNNINNRINNNYGKTRRKYSGLNNNIYNNFNNNTIYMNQNDNIFTESLKPYNNQNNNIPFKYPSKYPKGKINNNNKLFRNTNNQILNNNNITLNKNLNINNKRNNNIPNANMKNIQMNKNINNIKSNKQPQNNLNKNVQYNKQKINLNKNLAINNNIKNNVNNFSKNNLRNGADNPKKLLNNYNTDQKIRNNNFGNKIQDIRKKRIFEDLEEEDEENLSNLADKLFEMGKESKKKNKKKENNKPPLNQNLDNNNKAKEEEKIINNEIQIENISSRNKNKQVEEIGCQAEMSKNSINSNKNKKESSKKDEIKNEKKVELVDIGISIQASLLPVFQKEPSYNQAKDLKKSDDLQIQLENSFNIIREKEEEIKNDEIKKNKIEEKNDPNNIIVKNIIKENINEENQEEKNIDNDTQKSNKENSKEYLRSLKNSLVKETEEIIEDNNQQDDLNNFDIGNEIIDSDNEEEKEKEEKKKRKNKRIKFDFDKNVYFNFLQNDIMSKCQVRKGLDGNLEYYQPRKEGDDMDSHIIFEKKPTIKQFNKDEIKVDKNYELRENMEERRIVPDLYEDEEVEDDYVNEFASYLRASIDKSTDASINESIKKSINQSYNQSITGSLFTSTNNNNEGQGILRRLRAEFESSVNREI